MVLIGAKPQQGIDQGRKATVPGVVGLLGVLHENGVGKQGHQEVGVELHRADGQPVATLRAEIVQAVESADGIGCVTNVIVARVKGG